MKQSALNQITRASYHIATYRASITELKPAKFVKIKRCRMQPEASVVQLEKIYLADAHKILGRAGKLSRGSIKSKFGPPVLLGGENEAPI